MNIKIPPNDYKHPEPREEVVQRIVNCFLGLPPYLWCDGRPKPGILEVNRLSAVTTKYISDRGFRTESQARDDRRSEEGDGNPVLFYESEVQIAFDELIAAGYHVFLCSNYDRTTSAYKVCKEDYAGSDDWFETEHVVHHWD